MTAWWVDVAAVVAVAAYFVGVCLFGVAISYFVAWWERQVRQWWERQVRRRWPSVDTTRRWRRYIAPTVDDLLDRLEYAAVAVEQDFGPAYIEVILYRPDVHRGAAHGIGEDEDVVDALLCTVRRVLDFKRVTGRVRRWCYVAWCVHLVERTRERLERARTLTQR